MSQIVKRKKKGRPSKADLARRAASSPPEPTYELRRSQRRRNVTYNFDFDDFLDDDEEDEAEEERRRERKVKLVLKLNQGQGDSDSPARGRGRPPARRRRVAEEEEEEEYKRGEEEEQEEEEEDGVDAEEEEEDDDSEKKPVKRRKINGDGEDYDEDSGHGSDDVDEDEERTRKGGANLRDSLPGSRCESHSGTPIPADKKSLELILDKLQKKDIYGVYAEPVDPEELPDYHDIIEHPMDFATVRTKLANGSYPTLEHFESDVFLICSNAMQYNSPDTVYYKQARTIQEMAKKKFEKIRVKIERAEKEHKSEQKLKPNSTAKKQIKKPVGSDLSSGAELATGGATQNDHILSQSGGYEKPSSAEVPGEVTLSIVDNNLERAEELSSGKGFLNKFGKKPSAVDENRRATYGLSNQPVDRSESIYTTFEAEIKQLVAVGLHAENSYARSLARFAAMLGPLAWRIASQRIEQALPAGIKFGRGWVGEYEPLPTPVVVLENQARKDSTISTKSQSVIMERKDEIPFRTRPMLGKEHPTREIASEGKSPLINSGKKAPFVSCEPRPGTPLKAISQQEKPNSWNCVEPRNKTSLQVELNLPPYSTNQTAPFSNRHGFSRSEGPAPKLRDTVVRHTSLPSNASAKQQLERNGIVPTGFPNGTVTSLSNSRMVNLSSDNVANQMARATTSSSQQPDQGVRDSVQFMRVLTEQAKRQQNTSSQAQVDTSSSGPPMKRDDSNNAALAAARAWMSIGAGGICQTTENSSSPRSQISAESLYNPARDLHPQVSRIQGEVPVPSGMQFRPQRSNHPFQAFVQQPVVVNGAQFQNRPPMVVPQFVASDVSRFPVQPSWRGVSLHLPHIQMKQKQDNLPPDLNIGVQSPDSPAKQSSGVRVDSQQPDLALQL